MCILKQSKPKQCYIQRHHGNPPIQPAISHNFLGGKLTFFPSLFSGKRRDHRSPGAPQSPPPSPQSLTTDPSHQHKNGDKTSFTFSPRVFKIKMFLVWWLFWLKQPHPFVRERSSSKIVPLSSSIKTRRFFFGKMLLVACRSITLKKKTPFFLWYLFLWSTKVHHQ